MAQGRGKFQSAWAELAHGQLCLRERRDAPDLLLTANLGGCAYAIPQPVSKFVALGSNQSNTTRSKIRYGVSNFDPAWETQGGHPQESTQGPPQRFQARPRGQGPSS